MDVFQPVSGRLGLGQQRDLFRRDAKAVVHHRKVDQAVYDGNRKEKVAMSSLIRENTVDDGIFNQWLEKQIGNFLLRELFVDLIGSIEHIVI